MRTPQNEILADPTRAGEGNEFHASHKDGRYGVVSIAGISADHGFAAYTAIDDTNYQVKTPAKKMEVLCSKLLL